MQIQTKLDGQQRADQTDVFRSEPAILEDEQILSVDTNQRAALTQYHDQLADQLAATFDIDATSRHPQFYRVSFRTDGYLERMLLDLFR